jgi:hypothetical protein
VANDDAKISTAHARRAELENERSELEIVRARKHLDYEEGMMYGQLKQLIEGLIYGKKLGDAEFAAHTKAAIEIGDSTPALAEPMPDLLPLIIDLPNILVVGGKGSGKTTLLMWLIQERLNKAIVTIFDSHSHPAKWPSKTKVVGCGRNYADIWGAMMSLVEVMNRRYQEYASGRVGERQHRNIVNVIDEFTLLPTVFKDKKLDIKEYSKPLLTEGRKVAMDVVWGIHSVRAEALGLQGAYDLLECFDAVVYLVKVKGKPAYAQVDFGEGADKSIKYRLPGPFVIPGQASPPVNDGVPLLAEPVGDMWHYEPPEPEPDEEEAQAIAAFTALRDSGEFSWRKVTQAAFGEGRYGQTYNDKLKAILDKFHVDYSE